MMHGSKSQAVGTAEAALEEASKRDEFLAAVFFVDEEGKLVLKRTTWNFPRDRFGEVSGMLTGNLMEEVRKQSEPDRSPLPLAARKKFGFEDGAAVLPRFPFERDDGDGND